jgi:hypothetical protein
VTTSLLAAGVLACGACHRAFACNEDGECNLDGQTGRCEPTGDCSFADETCASGWRYGEHAHADRAGKCVPEGVAETGVDTEPSTTTAPGTSGEATTTSAATTATTTDATTGPIVPGDPCVDGLVDSPPVVATADGQVIEGLRIDAAGEPAIRIEGFTDVVVRNCELHHDGGPGLLFRNADRIQIHNVVVVHDTAAPSGPHDDGAQINVVGSDSEEVVMSHVRVTRGASGIELEHTPGATLSFIEGHDIRGPGEAAFVRLFESDDAVLEDFSCENPLDSARPFNLVEIASSSDAIVRRGLLDGHNAEFGYGVHFTQTPGQHSGGLVEDVDAVRMTNGSFSCFSHGTDITFRRTRARENICEITSIDLPDCKVPGPNGGCTVGSNGVSWGASQSSTGIVIEESAYFDLCWEPLWPDEVFTVEMGGLVELDFEPRPPIRTTACWEGL